MNVLFRFVRIAWFCAGSSDPHFTMRDNPLMRHHQPRSLFCFSIQIQTGNFPAHASSGGNGYGGGGGVGLCPRAGRRTEGAPAPQKYLKTPFGFIFFFSFPPKKKLTLIKKPSACPPNFVGWCSKK